MPHESTIHSLQSVAESKDILQLPIELVKTIILAGNSAIVFALIFTMLWLAIRLYKNSHYEEYDPRKLKPIALRITSGLFWLSAGISLRIGYWIPAVLLSSNDQNFHPWFLINRWWMVIIASILILTGTSILLSELLGRNSKFRISFVFIALILGSLFAISRGYLI